MKIGVGIGVSNRVESSAPPPIPPLPDFISSWKTDNPGTSTSTQISLPLQLTGTYNFNVNWGDGTNNTITVWNQAETTHTYSVAGTYTVTITGTCIGWRFASGLDRRKLLNISQFGPLRLGNDGGYFNGCNNLTITAADALNLNGTSNLDTAFALCSSLSTVPSMTLWNTGNVTSMNYMFVGCNLFNQDISSWNTGSVTSFVGMLNSCHAFNQNIGGWNTGSATTFREMFFSASAFNQNISGWDTNSVTSFIDMFNNAIAFNQNIGAWDIANVVTMNSMFLNSALSNANYDNILISWSAKAVRPSVAFHAGLAKYSAGAAATARAKLIETNLWTITDGGLAT